MIAACGSPEGSVVPSTGEVDGTIGFSFWGGPARVERVQDIVDLFEERNDGVTVVTDVADYASYRERMTVRAAGGGLSDVVAMQSSFAAIYAESGVLRPLDDLIDSGELHVGDISEEELEAGRVDGRQYVIPTGTFVRPLTYNESLVESSGAGAPADELTWEEYADWLLALQDGLPVGVVSTELEGPIMFTLTSWVIGHDRAMFDDSGLGFEEELLAEYFRFWIELTAAGATVPPAGIADQTGALELAPFALGETASATRDIPHMGIVETTLEGSSHPSSVGWVNAPTNSTSASGNVLGVNGLAIPATCQNVATAAAFIEFFANDLEAARLFGSDNGVVCNTAAQAALLEDTQTSPEVLRSIQVLQQLSGSGQLSSTTYPAGYSSLTTELARLYENVAFGEMSVDTAVRSFFTTADHRLG